MMYKWVIKKTDLPTTPHRNIDTKNKQTLTHTKFIPLLRTSIKPVYSTVSVIFQDLQHFRLFQLVACHILLHS